MNINVSAVTSHFPNPQDGFTTTTSGSVSSGASTVGLNSTGDYSNGDVVVLIVDPADADKKQVFVGTIDISGSQVTNVVWVGGTNQAHNAGATIVDYYDAAHVRMMTKGILVHANQDGTLKNGAVHSADVLGNNVVTGAKILDGAVGATKLANGAATADKLATGATPAFVATPETTTSTSYTDLATTTDTVTVTIGSNGLAWVVLTCQQTNNTNGTQNFMSFAASGANTIAADDSRAFMTKVLGGLADDQGSFVYLASGLNPGSTTFKAKYKVSGGTGTFTNRRIAVMPI